MRYGTLARVIVGASVFALCGWLMRRNGGMADAALDAPHGAGSGDGGVLAGGADDVFEATERFVWTVAEAHVECPSLTRGTYALSAHWRRMDVPFSRLDVVSRKVATSIALRTSDSEVQWAVATKSGEWKPDARVWNMSEGSYDQREALFAPTPCTISYPVAVPSKARLTFSPGTANTRGDATVFSIEIISANGKKTVAYEKRILPEVSRKWVDESIDLTAFAGQKIELRFITRSDPRASNEPSPAVRAPPKDADGGAPREAQSYGDLTLALWGNPTLIGRKPASTPYNILFIVVDALRPDVIASFHDEAEDQKKQAAPLSPLETLLPVIPGLLPNLEGLAKKGVRFVHAYSGGAWTRPGTLSMLSGARSTELGIDTLPWVLPDGQVQRYYASDPPLLPLLLRRTGTVTRAFVNNYFMVGYAPVGVDMGFERVDDHRYRARDTQLITEHALDWLDQNKDERFFLFCNYNSPHEPWEPPQRFLDRVPPPPAGPRDEIVRRYMAEAAKDDEAIGQLLQKLDALGLREKTLIIVTADHGETLSQAHAGISKLDHMGIRYHHAASNYEETSRVPILMSLPGVLPQNATVTARVRNVDIAPTVLEIEGMDPNARMSGKSMLALAKGGTEPEERVVLTEGRGTRGFIHGHYRLLVREGLAMTTMIGDKEIVVSEELFDLDADPGERRNIAKSNPDVLADMRARLDAAKKNVPTADAKVAPSGPLPRIRLRFAGAGTAHRVSGSIAISGSSSISIEPINIAKDAVKVDGTKIELALTTSADDEVGFDARVDPPSSDMKWDLFLDDKPWPKAAIYGGAFGLHDVSIEGGLASEEARAFAYSPVLPHIDPQRDLGVFVVRERRGDLEIGHASGDESNAEMNRLLKEWGYAHGSSK